MTKNTGYYGYRLFLNDDSIIEHRFKKPIRLVSMLHRIVKFARQNKLVEVVEGFEVLNLYDPDGELYTWQELPLLCKYLDSWKEDRYYEMFVSGRKEEE